MKPVLPTTLRRRAKRLFWVAVMLVCLQGAECGHKPTPATGPATQAATPVFNGNDPSTPLEATAAKNLYILINAYEVQIGIGAYQKEGEMVQGKDAMDYVAWQCVTGWKNSGLSPTFSFNVTSACNACTDINDWFNSGTFILLQGYSTSANAWAALQANPTFMNMINNPNYNKMGVYAINSGNGNYWAIIMTHQYKD